MRDALFCALFWYNSYMSGQVYIMGENNMSMVIAHMPDNFTFHSDSQVVEALDLKLCQEHSEFGAYFILSAPRMPNCFETAGMASMEVFQLLDDTKILSAYGIEGIVPWNHKHAYHVAGENMG